MARRETNRCRRSTERSGWELGIRVNVWDAAVKTGRGRVFSCACEDVACSLMVGEGVSRFFPKAHQIHDLRTRRTAFLDRLLQSGPQVRCDGQGCLSWHCAMPQWGWDRNAGNNPCPCPSFWCGIDTGLCLALLLTRLVLGAERAVRTTAAPNQKRKGKEYDTMRCDAMAYHGTAQGQRRLAQLAEDHLRS